MKNKFTVSDDGLTATIQLKRRNGDIVLCTVDADDLPKLQTLRITWHSQWHPRMRTFYVTCHVPVNGKQKKLSMHRFLTDAPEGLDVDHWNHDTTDNRRSNMRVVTRSVNSMNRRGAKRDSTTGHRGISPCRRLGNFVLKVTINGERKTIGYFATVEEALTARDSFPEYARKRGS